VGDEWPNLAGGSHFRRAAGGPNADWGPRELVAAAGNRWRGAFVRGAQSVGAFFGLGRPKRRVFTLHNQALAARTAAALRCASGPALCTVHCALLHCFSAAVKD